MTLELLPALNAVLNGLSALFLALGFISIRRGAVQRHRRFMLAALLTSTCFLVGYLSYHSLLAWHYHRGPTIFKNPAWFRPIYLSILGSHTLLAAVILPLVLITLTRALRERFAAHRRLARWTWPLWIYVSATGVLIYLLLYRIFPQAA